MRVTASVGRHAFVASAEHDARVSPLALIACDDFTSIS